jgi:signal peptidase I
MTVLGLDQREVRRVLEGGRSELRPYARARAGARGLHVKLLLLGAVALAVVWTGLLPQQLGGRTSYVITSGVSMLPDFHAGDLVVVRREPTYHVGEVAAFHNQQLHVVVLHRIVAIRGDHYVFKGDNNTWYTTYEPTKAQIVGAAWLHVPRAGRILGDLRVPAVAAVLLALLWLYSFWPQQRTRHQRRRHRHAR